LSDEDSLPAFVVSFGVARPRKRRAVIRCGQCVARGLVVVTRAAASAKNRAWIQMVGQYFKPSGKAGERIFAAPGQTCKNNSAALKKIYAVFRIEFPCTSLSGGHACIRRWV